MKKTACIKFITCTVAVRIISRGKRLNPKIGCWKPSQIRSLWELKAIASVRDCHVIALLYTTYQLSRRGNLLKTPLESARIYYDNDAAVELTIQNQDN